MPATSATMTFAGLEHDRRFIIVDSGGTFRSQRRDPILAVIRCAVDGDVLTLSHTEHGSIEVSPDVDSPAREISMFRTPFRGVDQGEEAAEWLSAVIGEQSRLMALPRDSHRVTDGINPGTAAFADSSAVHILSEATLTALNARLEVPVPMNRFRPNIVVDGVSEPHREDALREVTVGSTRLAWTKPAVRCAVTTVDQSTGVRTGAEPLRTLGTYRKVDGGVAFGAKFTVLQEGSLSVGDELHADR